MSAAEKQHNQYMRETLSRKLMALILAATLSTAANSAHAQTVVTRGTPVTRIRSLVTLNIRSGPHINYPVVGRLHLGDHARVIGASQDYNWWRISCQLRSCWVSANPRYTRPVAWQ